MHQNHHTDNDDESEGSENLSSEESSLSESEGNDSMAVDSADEHGGRSTENAFDGMISKAYHEHKNEKERIISELMAEGLGEAEAVKRAHHELLPKYRKTLRSIFKKTLYNIQLLRKHPVYKTIMNKVKDLELEGFDREEAISAALTYRKHLVYRMIPSDAETDDDDDDDGDDDMDEDDSDVIRTES